MIDYVDIFQLKIKIQSNQSAWTALHQSRYCYKWDGLTLTLLCIHVLSDFIYCYLYMSYILYILHMFAAGWTIISFTEMIQQDYSDSQMHA